MKFSRKAASKTSSTKSRDSMKARDILKIYPKSKAEDLMKRLKTNGLWMYDSDFPQDEEDSFCQQSSHQPISTHHFLNNTIQLQPTKILLFSGINHLCRVPMMDHLRTKRWSYKCKIIRWMCVNVVHLHSPDTHIFHQCIKDAKRSCNIAFPKPHTSVPGDLVLHQPGGKLGEGGFNH